MPTLYVANVSHQSHDFQYRILEGGVRRQTIAPGQQILVFKRDLSLAEVEHIISQHGQYGMRAANEIVRTKSFIGLCYSVDKPVDIDKFMVADEQNADALITRNFEIQKTSAIATEANLRQMTEQAGRVTVEVNEEAKGAQASEASLLRRAIEVDIQSEGDESKTSNAKPSRRRNR